MTTEPQPTDPTPDGPPVETDPETPPVEPPPTGTETPPQPALPASPITFEPGLYYKVESVCLTPTCPNLNTTTIEPMVYSNAGAVRMVCGLCGKDRTILSASKLDPQPEVS